MGTKMQGDGQEPRQTFRVAPKIATIRLGFRVHLGNPGQTENVVLPELTRAIEVGAPAVRGE